MSLCVCVLVACATSSAALSLQAVVPQKVSQSAGKHDGTDLLEVGQLSNRSLELTSAEKAIDSKMDALSAYVTNSYEQHEAALKADVVSYGKMLADQRHQTNAIESNMEQLRDKIGRQEDTNKLTRDTATKLLESSTALVQSIRRIEANLTFAQDFARDALDHAEGALENDTAIKVLADLDTKDETRRAEYEHKRKLQKLHQGVLLQVGVTSSPQHSQAMGGNATNLVSSLASSLNELSTEQSSSLELLKANYTEEFKAGQVHQASLLKEQTELEAELQREEGLDRELQAAVAHLRETNTMLETRSRGLEAFASRLSKLGNRSHAQGREAQTRAAQLVAPKK